MKSYFSLVVPALLSAPLFAAAPQGAALSQAPALMKSVESPEKQRLENRLFPSW